MCLLMKDRAFFVEFFYKNDGCSLAALKKFRSLKGMKKGRGPLSVMAVKKILKKFEETGSLK